MYLPSMLIMKFLEPMIKEEPSSEEDMDIWCREMSLECMLCSKTFHSITGLKAHVIALHSYKTVKRKIRNIPSPAKKERKDVLICATCRRTFFTSIDLMVHEWQVHSKLACYVCHQNFDNFSLLTEHRKRCTVTATSKPKTLDDVKRLPADDSKLETVRFSCPACPEQCSDEYHLKEHQEIQHSAANSDLTDNATNTDKMKETATTQNTRENLEGEDETVKEKSKTFGCVNRTSNDEIESDNVSKEAKGGIKDTYENKPKTSTVTTEADGTNMGQNFEGVSEIVRNVHETIPANDITLKISEITSDVDLNQLYVNRTLVSINDNGNTGVVNVPINEEGTMKYINKEVENVYKDTDESEVSTIISQIRTDIEEQAAKILTENLHVSNTKKASEIETSKHVEVSLQKPDNVITSEHVNKIESTALLAVNETSESSSALMTGEKTILDKEIAQIKQSTVVEALETVNKTRDNITGTVEENKEKLDKINKTLETLKEIPKNIIGTITKVDSDKLKTIFGVVSTESKSEVDL